MKIPQIRLWGRSGISFNSILLWSMSSLYVKVLLSATTAVNVHNIFHALSQMDKQFYSFRSQKSPSRWALDATPPIPPGDDGASKHEGITDKIQPITFSSSMDFFFLSLYKHIVNRFTHETSAGLWPSEKKKKSSSPIKYCLSWSRNGKNMKSIIVTVATMIANIHIMSNKLRSMYNVEQKQHAGETTEPFYKTICPSV